MTKQQREYTIERIKKISKGKAFECECEKPDLTKHIRRSIATGSSKMKSAKEITAMYERRIVEQGDSYRDMEANVTQLFEQPQSYKDAMAELAREQKKHADANEKTARFAQSLIDRIELGEFDDGKEPILLMEGFTPVKPR
jgi:hypothetical protein